jgi:YVTN family beta-propeller protein
MKYLIYICLFAILLNSCIKDPTSPENQKVNKIFKGAFILNEGIWNQNNSSIDRIDLSSLKIFNNIYKIKNNEDLGDLANDLIIKGDTAIAIISTQNMIILFKTEDCSKLISYKIPGERLLRKCATYDNNKLLITDLYSNSLLVFNLLTGKVESEIEIGAAPEQLIVHKSLAYVVNSGYGDYLANHPKASSVSIVDLNIYKEINNSKTGANPIEIIKNDKRNSFFIAYRNLPSIKDTFGGLIEYNLDDYKLLNHWKLNVVSPRNSISQDSLFFISDYGLSAINFNSNKIINLLQNPNKFEKWYSIGVNSNNSYIYIGNAKNYQMEGELLIINRENNYSKIDMKLKTGVNPNKIEFY